MNQEKFFSLIPMETVKEEEVAKRIEEEQNLVEQGKKYTARLSINRYLDTKLTDFDLNERLTLFSTLVNSDFVYDENKLYFNPLGMEAFCELLRETFDLKEIYELDNFYIEKLLNGEDIMEKEMIIDGESFDFSEILKRFVFAPGWMDMGDTPPLTLMLVVKKALLGSYVAEQNVKALQEGKRDIYNVSVLL